MARIALDIDSTLHDYWPLFRRVVRDRHGLDLPYEHQREWGTTLLSRDEVVACIEETHSDENILCGRPYPGAVETVAGWHRDGHWIHITSHRRNRARDATAEWLDRIGMPYDDLHCSFDKVSRCVELGIDVLVDDSPVNLIEAKREGIVAATLIHPWNEEVVAAGDAIGAISWGELRVKLAPVLS
jgi:phosphoglycolate phosphatase-like HAD superfamily hydrolase